MLGEREGPPEEVGQESTGQTDQESFFGSVKAGEVNKKAAELTASSDPGDRLAGHMVNTLIEETLTNFEMTRKQAEQSIDSEFNYDVKTGEQLDSDLKVSALETAMGYFDDLQEMRDRLMEARKSRTEEEGRN